MFNPLRHPDDAEPWPIAVTTGGPIDPLDHVGHIAEYHALMAAVAHGQVGALCTGDRRMGKTSMLRLLEAGLNADDSYEVLKVSAETHEPDIFAGHLRDAARQASWLKREFDRWHLDVEVGYKGMKLRRDGGRTPLPADVTDDLLVFAARKAAPRRLVVIIDEISVLVGALAKKSADHGMEFLHSLRRARQEGADNLSIVLAGSLGLHHVVPSMQAVNDLTKVRLASLTDDEARFLARCLIEGAGIDTAEPDALADAMASTADNGAFYLHHIADQLGRLGRRVDPSDAGAVIESMLTDPDDLLNFRHYRDRIPEYYGEDAALAIALLDHHAATTNDLAIDDSVRLISTTPIDNRPTRFDIVRVTELLEQDHYLARRTRGSSFASSLLRRAWIGLQRLN